MPSVGAVTSNLNIVTKTSAYTAIANDFVLASAASGAVTITLPANPAMNTVIAVKKTDATTSAVSVVPSGAATIDGDTVAILAVSNASITLQFDGTNWRMLSTATINTANAAAGLPSGGTAGQVLSKNSASNYDASWGAVASNSGGLFSPWTVPGRYYFVPASFPPATYTPTDTYTRFYPVRIPNACTLATISILNSGGSGSSAYLGLYNDSPVNTVTSGGPTTRVAGASISIPSYTTTIGTLTVNTAVPAGNYWVSLSLFSTTNLSLVGVGNPLFNFLIGSKDAVTTSSFWSASQKISTTYNGGAAPPADVSTLTFQNQNDSNKPLFLFTVS